MSIFNQKNFFAVVAVVLFFLSYGPVEAATLQLSPNTGVYSAGTNFSARVLVNTDGAPINAAEGTITFNPKEVQVVSIDRSSSIFNLWVTEPSFSNSAGTINFSGGLPSGYTGSAGTIFTLTFRSTNAGTARVQFTTGAVLANDGRGTNVLSGMNGGTFTIQAQAAQPVPEIIEYIPQANTPASPNITSKTHLDPTKWYADTDAVLSWNLPAGVTAVRTLLDTSPTGVPTRVYETPISTITLSDLPEGVSYFHLQFKNDEGWGKVSHYRLAVDTQKPEAFTIGLAEGSDLSSPQQTLALAAKDSTSAVNRYLIKIDAAEPYEFIDQAEKKVVTLSDLSPGYHTIIVEAFDQAGNSLIASTAFTISAFDRPLFTDYPREINEEVIPVIKGLTRPSSEVTVLLRRVGSSDTSYTTKADEGGVFTFIPESTFTVGVYELSATAVDTFGAQSEPSDTIRIAVQKPGYVQLGEKLVSILSVFVSLLGLLFLLAAIVWGLFFYLRRLRSRVTIESVEAIAILKREFSVLQKKVTESQSELIAAKKTKKLSETEERIFSELRQSLAESEQRVYKEVKDVENLVHTQESLPIKK